MIRRKAIYLAGKAHGRKWEIAPEHPYISYHASDYKDHCAPPPGFNDPYVKRFVHESCTDSLAQCDGLLAILDTPDSYGSIAEIAYMSALGKDSIVIIIRDPHSDWETWDPEREFDFENPRVRWPPIIPKALDNIRRRRQMFDAYWLVSNFPHVTTILVESEDEAVNAIQRSIGELLVESPIERLFWQTFIACGDPDLPVPQYPIGNYRLDFAFPDEKIAIEIDGHDYHKEVEQRSADAKRDRDLLKEGWATLRFTGSDVHRNAGNVINEVRAFVREKRQSEIAETQK